MLVDGILIWAASLATVGGAAWLLVNHWRNENRALGLAMQRRAEVEARYHAIFENMPLGCMVWEPGFRIVEWNRQAERIFGWTRPQMLGRSFADALLADEARDAFMRDAAHLLAGSLMEGQLRHHTRDGEAIVCQWHHEVLHDSGGAPTQVVSTCINVTPLNDLQAENALFRKIIDLTDDPSIMLLDASSGKVVHASASSHRHLGRPDLIGRVAADWDIHLSPDIASGYERTLHAKRSISFETEHRHADGQLIPVEVTLNLIEHGGKHYVAAYTRNISARRAEAMRVRNLEITAALREHEKHYREVFENSSDALFTVEVRNGTRLSFDTANPAAEQALGLPAGLLKGMRFGALADGEMGEDFGTSIVEHLPEYLSCALTGMPAAYEGPLDLLPGRGEDARLYHVQLFPLAADQGIERIICIGHDITEQRRYAEALLERSRLQEQIGAVAQAVPGFLFTVRVEPDGRAHFPYASAGVEELFGLRPEEFRDDAEVLRAHYHPDDLVRVRAGMAETQRTLAPFRIELRIRHPRQEGWRWIALRSTPQRQPDGATEWHGLMIDISEAKRNEQALEDSRLELQDHLSFTRELIEAMPNPVFYKDTEGRYLGFNAAFERSVGKSREEMIGKGVFELWPRDLAERYFAADRQLLENPGSQTYETQMQTTSGRRDVVFHKATFTRADGSIGGQIGSYIDITESKRMAERLAESEWRWKFALEGSGQGVWDWDLKSGNVEYSALYKRMLGYAPDEFPERVEQWESRVHPDDLAAAQDSHRAQFAGETDAYEAEFRMRCKDGSWKWIHSRGMVVQRDADGKVLRIIGTHADIDARKRMQDALAAREEKFRALTENSPDVIVRYDEDGRRIYINRAYAALHGVEQADVLGKTVREAGPLSDGHNATLHDMIAGVLASGKPSAVEVTWQRGDGAEFCFHIRAVPEFGANGKIASVLSVGRDITVLKQTEQRLEQSRQLLQRFSARREEEREGERKRVARELHEEFGQMLTALRMNISTLPMQFGEQLPALHQQSRTMLALVDRTIRSMRDVVASLRPTVLDAGIGLGLEWLADSFRRDTGLPCALHVPQVDDAIGEDAAILVFRVIQEALGNVARHARASHVEVRLECGEDNWCAEVRDDGCGFDAGAQSRKSLGVFGMEQCAAILGGKLEIDSAPGRGTTLRLRFPAR